MAIGFERQQKSLIGANLPTARLDIQPADFSGVQRLGNAIMNAGARIGDERARRKEQGRDINDALQGSRQAYSDFQTLVGKSPDGPVEVVVPKGSPAYQSAYLTAFNQAQDGRFRQGLETSFIEIQNKFQQGELTAEEATLAMQKRLEGQLAGTPEHRRAYYTELGQTELLQRSSLMNSQQSNQRQQLAVEDLTTTILKEVDEATSHVAANGDPAFYYNSIDAKYDTLVRLNRMGPEQAKIAKANVRMQVEGQAFLNRLTSALAKGEVSGSDIGRFAAALERNDNVAATEITVNRSYRSGGPGNTTIPEKYAAKDVFTKITDEKKRKEIGFNLRQAAANWQAEQKLMAERTALRDQLLFQDGPTGMYTALPSSFHDDADLLVSNILATAKPFDTPEGENVLLSTLAAARYAPKPLVKQLVAMVNSQDDAQVQKAVQMWQKITTLTTKHGVAAGDLIWRDITEEDRNFLDAVRDAYSLQYPVRDIVDNMKTARGSRNFAMDQLIADYNSAVSGQDRGFEKDFLARWQQDFGGAADPQASDSFAKAYRQSMIILRDPERAFTDAYDRMKKVYQKSDIFVSGVARTGRAPLTNPYGYEGRTNLLGEPAAGTEYDWLKDYIAADVSLGIGSGAIRLPADVTPDEINQVFKAPPPPQQFSGGRGGAVTAGVQPPDYLGTRIKLMPMPGSNPDAPEYALRLFDEQGNDLGYLMKNGPDGRVMTYTINPHVQRAQEEGVAIKMEKRKALEEAAKYSQDQLMIETIRKNGINVEGDPRAYQQMPFEDYLGGVDREVEKQYRLDKMEIEDGLKRALQQLEQEPGTPIKPSSVSPQSLLMPRAAGFDVAAAAASQIDSVLPDGTNGTFLLRIAAQESAFGTAGGTYRMVGDKGLMQTNTYSSVKEVQRQIASGRGRVWEANEKLKQTLGLDLGTITTDDLDKPLVSMAMARLYFEAIGTPVPANVEGQAAWWKRHYNTHLGAGTTDQFLRSARKVPDNWRDRYTVKG